MPTIRIDGPDGPEKVHLLREEEPHGPDERHRVRTPEQNMARWQEQERAEETRRREKFVRPGELFPWVLWIFAGMTVVQLLFGWPL